MDMHNHTRWSDGYQTVQELVESAISNGVSHLGITDHLETIKCPSLPMENIPAYIAEIKSIALKYQNQIKLFAGVEINVRSEETKLENLNFAILNQLDFVLWEYVDQRKQSLRLNQLKEYTKNLVIPSGLAHTSLELLAKKYDEEGGIDRVLKLFAENKLFWEINVNEGYRYSKIFFDPDLETEQVVKNIVEKLLEYKIPVSIGTDCHSQQNTYIENRVKIHQFVKKNKLLTIF